MKKVFIATLAFMALSAYSVNAQTSEINQRIKNERGVLLIGQQNMEPFNKKPFKAWYDEGETYDYSTANEYNHFTQVVWKGSKKVGCAYKDCRSTGWGLYIVCEYDPAGNIIGWEKANVLP